MGTGYAGGGVVAVMSRDFAQDAIALHERMRSAAPALLAAAERAESFIAGFDDDNKADDVAGMLRDLRAAIAKATGAKQ